MKKREVSRRQKVRAFITFAIRQRKKTSRWKTRWRFGCTDEHDERWSRQRQSSLFAINSCRCPVSHRVSLCVAAQPSTFPQATSVSKLRSDVKSACVHVWKRCTYVHTRSSHLYARLTALRNGSTLQPVMSSGNGSTWPSKTFIGTTITKGSHVNLGPSVLQPTKQHVGLDSQSSRSQWPEEASIKSNFLIPEDTSSL